MKSMQVFVVLALFVVFESCAADEDGLQCYVCNDCQPNFVTQITSADTETCADIILVDERCVKEIDAKGVINRRCGTTADCAITESLSKCDGEKVKPCSICCEGDKCNSANTFHISAFVILVAAAMHKFIF